MATNPQLDWLSDEELAQVRRELGQEALASSANQIFLENHGMINRNGDPHLYQVRNNPLHARFPSDPDTRRRLERVVGQPIIDSADDHRPSILFPVVIISVIVFCAIGIVYVIVYGV